MNVDPLIRPDVFFYEDAMRFASMAERMLDFGAGRGNAGKDFRTICKEVRGCDVDPVVLTNPYLHGAEVIKPGTPLPYPDNHFDLIVSRYVLEHLDDPSFITREIVRILKPGAHFCAVTPNKYGYIALIAKLIPDRLHTAVLRFAKPGVNIIDIFPKHYRMNTEKRIRRLFEPHGEILVLLSSGGSDYDFGFKPLMWLFQNLNRWLPRALQTAMYLKFRKRPTEDAFMEAMLLPSAP